MNEVRHILKEHFRFKPKRATDVVHTSPLSRSPKELLLSRGVLVEQGVIGTFRAIS